MRERFLTEMVSHAIARAVRRGVVRDGFNLSRSWVAQRNARPESVKRHGYGVALLNDVATHRRRGDLATARYHLQTVRWANRTGGAVPGLSQAA